MPVSIANSAALRFFKSPELLSLLMSYLALERNDLLTLAAVSKHLRAHALRAWARYLDLRLSSANRLHRFFVRNPGLASSVRYLRLREDIKERFYSFGDADSPVTANIKRGKPQWPAAQELLGLIAQTDPTHEPTLIDVTIGLTDAGRIQGIFSAHPTLTRGLVAMRVIADVDKYPDDYDREEWDADDAEPIDPLEVPGIAAYIGAWEQNWTSLADILDAQHALPQEAGPRNFGLRAFAFHHEDHVWREEAPSESRWTPPAVPQRLWSSLSNTSQHTLRDLSLTLASDDNVEDICSLLAHTNIGSLNIQAQHVNDDAGPLQGLDTFLDRNPGIEELSLSLGGTSAGLSFRQTFPNLRWLDIQFAKKIVSAAQDRHFFAFASRHPHLKGMRLEPSASTSGSSFPNDIFPNLCKLITSPSAMEEHSERGGRLSFLTAICYDDIFSSIPFVTVSYPWAHAVTGLDLFLVFKSLAVALPRFETAFSAETMPHLAELQISYFDSGLPPRGDRSTFRRTLSALAHAPSLRVLKLHQLVKGRRQKKNLLVNFPAFPRSLEYLILKHGDINLSQCYRYLAPSDEVDVIGDYDKNPQEVYDEEEFDDYRWPYEDGQEEYDEFDFIPESAKPGRLQQIPPTFCIRIARDGVWERTANMYRHMSVLDHTSETPTLRVS
ncbi:hypothetical protein A4X13_0g7047 [Tilletia indica]|uniref:Uncharacterized protein n=1 Tax=Tilletia indica TaxID=43049 RepID=A0A177TVC1_9BASI|nr:hypothetical protein A4X13_0g7047 [Tilletia indica]